MREGRPGLETGRLAQLADGRILSAREALEAGLIDGIGYLEEATSRAKQLAGIKRARLVMYEREHLPRTTIYAGSDFPSPQARATLSLELGQLQQQAGPLFLYLWSPD